MKMLSMAHATRLQWGSQGLGVGPLGAVKTRYAQDTPRGVVQSATLIISTITASSTLQICASDNGMRSKRLANKRAVGVTCAIPQWTRHNHSAMPVWTA